MTYTDHLPMPNTPVTERLVAKVNNRLGAVLSASYQFWMSRESATRTGGIRRDAYSIITFSNTATVT
jgi:hypothetical protein